MTEINTKTIIHLNFNSIINILIKSLHTFLLVLIVISVLLTIGGVYLKHLIISPIKTLSMTTFFVGAFMGILMYYIFSEGESDEVQNKSTYCQCHESCLYSTEETPTTTDEIPNTIEEIPTTTEEIPNTIEEIPTTTEETLITFEEIPTTTDEIPNTIEETPTTTDEIPNTIEETPNAIEETPNAIEETLITLEETPTRMEED